MGSVAAQRRAIMAVQYDAGASSRTLAIQFQSCAEPQEIWVPIRGTERLHIMRCSVASHCKGQHVCAVRPVIPASVTAKGCPCDVVLVAYNRCRAMLWWSGRVMHNQCAANLQSEGWHAWLYKCGSQHHNGAKRCVRIAHACFPCYDGPRNRQCFFAVL